MDPEQQDEADSLENSDTVPESTPISDIQAPSGSSTETSIPSPDKQDGDKKDNPDKLGLFKKIILAFKRFDIYLLGFIFVILISIFALYLAYTKSKPQNNTTAQTQSLNQSAVTQLDNNDTSVGGSSQTLEIQSSTIFTNNVLMKGNLDVAGTLKLGGAINLPGITVSGTTQLDQVVVAGTETIAGSLTVNSGLSVSGTTAFSGNVSAPTLTVTTLQLNGDITISHHIITSGSIPHFASENLGSGGTGSVNGSDTAGTININLGSGATSCLAHITFSTAFGSTPHVVATLVGSSSSDISSLGEFYISELSNSGFSVCVSGASPSGSFNVNYNTLD
jgi:cytoskeletal protein CcmA (bactofilin family)